MGAPTWDEWTVCLLKVPVGRAPGPGVFRQAALRLWQALRPDVRGPVAIKPNVVWDTAPDSGVITHPAFVGGLVDALLAGGLAPGEIVVAEGGGIEGDHDMAEFFRQGGYRAEMERRGVELRDLNEDGYVELTVPQARVLHRLRVARTIVGEGRTVLNVAKMKTHNLATVTLAVKNMQGMLTPITCRHLCTPWPRHEADDGSGLDLQVVDRVERFYDKLVDLTVALHPQWHIIEGIVGRDGTGFHRGKNIPLGLALAGTNPLAVDAVGACLMGFAPADVGHLRAAAARGLPGTDLASLRVLEVTGAGLCECPHWQRYRSERPFEVIRRDDLIHPTA